jgi:DNA repair exonuclease SbcCD ATPase subunit
MRVLGLRSENIKRIVVVEIEPDPNAAVVRITGDNGAGKSSLLDSIAYAIGGKKLIPSNPIRTGQNRANIKVDLDDYIVVRSFRRTEGGYDSSLKVVAKDGLSISNGQAVLDRVLGRITFDPLEFAETDQKKQYDMLRGLVSLPIDLAKWQVENDALREQRLFSGRDLKQAEGAYQEAPYHKDAPKQEVDIEAESKELQTAEALRQNKSQLSRTADGLSFERDRLKGEVVTLQKQIADLKKQIKLAEARVTELEKTKIPGLDKDIARLDKEIAAVAVPDTAAIAEKITSADQINQKVRANKRKEELRKELEAHRKIHEDLEDAIKVSEQTKLDAFAQAKLPLPGLTFGDGVVLYEGNPLDQASDGEKIRISVAVAMALNPDLRVLLIRRGSLLSQKNQAVIEELAETAGYQIWMEIVDPGDQPGFMLEEGELVTSSND